jgi:acetyl-CoA carboxylase biotin carboxyl carrier protein
MSERIDIEQVREIIRLAEASDLAELEVETPALTVRVRRAADGRRALPTEAGAAAADPTPAAAAGAGRTDQSLDHLEPIVAPMVGTFYRAPSPDAPPLVNEGDLVSEGQVVCIIEAMKLFNEIQAEKPGRVVRILVENASPVEYGQPLFLLDPTARRG